MRARKKNSCSIILTKKFSNTKRNNNSNKNGSMSKKEKLPRCCSATSLPLFASPAAPSSCRQSHFTSSPSAGKRVIRVDLHLNQLKRRLRAQNWMFTPTAFKLRVLYLQTTLSFLRILGALNPVTR